MPNYNGTFCTGACERLGHGCVRSRLFTACAAEFSATTIDRTEIQVDTDEQGYEYPTEHTTTVLAVPLERQDEVAATLRRTFPDQTPEQVINNWAGEFPCHIECDITICGVCGRQHEANQIFKRPDGTFSCPYEFEDRPDDETYALDDN
jgi:hypothetical protein